MWILTLVTLALIGVLGVFYPRMTRPTVPLGVSVPSTHVDHPVIAAAEEAYRRLAVVAALVAVALAVAARLWLGPSDVRWSWVLLVGLFGLLAAQVTALRVASQPIREAKQREGWYEGVTVAVYAPVTAAAGPSARVPWGWHIAALAALAAAAAYGATIYGDLPERIVTHVGTGGPDAWGQRSVLDVFGPLLLGAATVALVALTAWAVARRPRRLLPGGDLEEARVEAARHAQVTQRIVGVTNVFTGATFAGLTVTLWLTPPESQATLAVAVTVAILVACAALVVWSIRVSVRTRRGDEGAARSAGTARPDATEGTAARSPESPDDDAHWKAGVFYYNPDDPAFLVDKRIGVGQTVNLAHWGGKVFVAVVVGLLAWTGFLLVTQV